MGGMIMTG